MGTGTLGHRCSLFCILFITNAPLHLVPALLFCDACSAFNGFRMRLSWHCLQRSLVVTVSRRNSAQCETVLTADRAMRDMPGLKLRSEAYCIVKRLRSFDRADARFSSEFDVDILHSIYFFSILPFLSLALSLSLRFFSPPIIYYMPRCRI